MQVITVIGETDAGKTTLLKYLFEQLKNSGGELLFLKNSIGKNFEDFEAILYWKGKKIGICSIGDAQKYIDNGIKEIIDQSLDFYINVVNTSFLSWYELNHSFANLKIIQIKKNYIEQTIKQKQNVCKQIISFLEQE